MRIFFKPLNSCFHSIHHLFKRPSLNLKESKTHQLAMSNPIAQPIINESPVIPNKQRQVEHVQKILFRLVQDYSGLFFGTLVLLLEEPSIKASLEKWLGEMTTSQMIQNSETFPNVHKKLILASSNGLEMFIRHFNESIDLLVPSGNFNENQAEIECLEKKLVAQMNELLKNENSSLALYNCEEFDEEKIRQHRKELIREFLCDSFPHFFKSDKDNNTLLFFLSVFLEKIVDTLCTPEVIFVLIDKIFCQDFSLTPQDKVLDEETPDYPLDNQFNEDLESLLTKLSKQAIHIASAGEPVITKLIYSKLIDTLMFFYKAKLSTLLQKVINDLLYSDMKLTPFIFLEQLLYTTENDQRVPAFPILKKDQEQFQLIYKRVETIFKSQSLFESINNKIKSAEEKGNAGFWIYLVKDSVRLKRLCSNLENTAFTLLQRPLLLKLLFNYLMENIRKEIILINNSTVVEK